MTPTGKTVATGLGAATIIAGYFLLRHTATTYNYCTDAVYYIRSCETGPYSVASETPGYAGEICQAHTYAWVGDDLFTYPYMDQGGTRTYARPPAAAGAVALAKWDDCYVNHNPTAFGNAIFYPCATAVAPGGTQTYHPVTLAQLAVLSPPQFRAYSAKYHCQLTPSPGVTTTPTPSGGLICWTITPATVCVTRTPAP